MTQRNKKVAILRQLGQESDPISLPDLMEKLGEGFSSRTVRRWLAELAKEGVIEKLGRKRGTKYAIIQGKYSSNVEVSGCFSSFSAAAIQRASLPIFERQAVSYNTAWLESYLPNKSYYLSSQTRKQLAKAGLRANEQDPAGTYAHQIFNRLIIDLSYNSSRLEGNTYSLLDTERLLLQGDIAENKLEEEKVMILNHKEAIRYLVENAAKVEVSYNTVCTLHYLLSDGLVENFEAGKVRRHGVRVGGSTYIPFEEPSKLENTLKYIVEKASKIKDPFEQSFFLLVHISYIQAFIDVNKRCARLCANIPLIKRNLVPLSFNDVDVDDYKLSVIAIYEFQGISPLADLFTYSYLRTCAAYDATVKSMGFDEIRVRYRQERRGVIRGAITQKLAKNKLDNYIKRESAKLIPKEHQANFIEDILEDLELLDETRLAGLGVDQTQFREWKSLNPSCEA